MTYKYLLFDIDDTLLDFHKAQDNAFKKLLAHFDIPFSNQIFNDYNIYNQGLWKQYEQGTLSRQQLLETRFSTFFKTFGLTVDGLKTDALFREFLAEGHQLFDGVHDVLNHCKKTHQLAIVTNGILNTQMTRLKNNDLLSYFEHIFVSEQVGYQKPDKRFFEHVMTTMGIDDPSKALIIGDTLHADILGGQRVGMDTCWVNLHQKINELDKSPTYTIQTISELLTLDIS